MVWFQLLQERVGFECLRRHWSRKNRARSSRVYCRWFNIVRVRCYGGFNVGLV
ncbi:unnamed protein product [Brassica oleracea var. botrytis]